MNERIKEIFGPQDGVTVNISKLQSDIGFSDYEMTTLVKGHLWARATRRFLSGWSKASTFPALTLPTTLGDILTEVSDAQSLYSGDILNPNYVQAYLQVFFRSLSAKELVLLPESVSRNIKNYLKTRAEKNNNEQLASFDAALLFGTQFVTVLAASAADVTPDTQTQQQIFKNSLPLVHEIAHMPSAFAKFTITEGCILQQRAVERICPNILSIFGREGIKKAAEFYKMLENDTRDWNQLSGDPQWQYLAYLVLGINNKTLSDHDILGLLKRAFMKGERLLPMALEELANLNTRFSPDVRFKELLGQIQMIRYPLISKARGAVVLNPEYFVFDESQQAFITNADNHYLDHVISDEIMKILIPFLAIGVKVEELLPILNKPYTWRALKNLTSKVGLNPGCSALVSLLAPGPLDGSSRAYLDGMPAHTIGFLAATVLRLTDTQNPPQFG